MISSFSCVARQRRRRLEEPQAPGLMYRAIKDKSLFWLVGLCVLVFLLLKWDSIWEKKEVLPFKERAMKQRSEEEENPSLSSLMGLW